MGYGLDEVYDRMEALALATALKQLAELQEEINTELRQQHNRWEKSWRTRLGKRLHIKWIIAKEPPLPLLHPATMNLDA